MFRYAHRYREAIELLASADPRLPPLEKLITQRFRGMEDIPRAFDMAARDGRRRGQPRAEGHGGYVG